MDPTRTTEAAEAATEKEPIVQTPSQFTDINISATREKGELYCDYKCRQWWVNRIMKFYFNGRVIWPGSQGQKIGSF